MASFALLMPACASWDGHFSILGYTTQPNYDLRFKTISVPIFKNRTPWNLTPAPGMEMDLTKAVINKIEMLTPYKVVSCNADTELRGTIINFQKNLLNYTQMNSIREAETTMRVELIWRDLRLRRGAHQGAAAAGPGARRAKSASRCSRHPMGTCPRAAGPSSSPRPPRPRPPGRSAAAASKRRSSIP